MTNEKRLIDANAFWNLLQQVVYDVFTVHEHDGKLNGTASVGYYTETIQEVLKQTPTVDAVEVVHGRWLFDSNTERYFCSACNEQALYTSRDVPEYDYDWEENLRYSHTETIIEEHLTNYCPNCGADMRGSEE